MDKATVDSIQKRLKRLADKTIADHSRRFFKTGPGEYGEGDKFLGIRVPVIRREVKQYLSLSPMENKKLLKSEFHEVRLFALILMVEQYKRSENDGREKIYQTYIKHTKYINNWDLVDTSAPNIVGAHLFERDRQILHEMVKSKNLWRRRIAIISTLYFIKQGELDDSLMLAAQLLDDKEDLIHKAVGWVLREVGKQNLAKEDRFLKKYYRNMPRTMLRYAIEKHPEKQRKAYLLGEV